MRKITVGLVSHMPVITLFVVCSYAWAWRLNTRRRPPPAYNPVWRTLVTLYIIRHNTVSLI